MGWYMIDMKICIPSLVKSYFLFISFFFGFSFIGVPYGFLVLLIWGSLNFFVKCPKCGKQLHISTGGIYRPPLLYCDKCGQNLMKCQQGTDHK